MAKRDATLRVLREKIKELDTAVAAKMRIMEQQRDRIKELEASKITVCVQGCPNYKEVAKENAALRKELDDWRTWYDQYLPKATRDEDKCKDEQIADLKELTDDIRDANNNLCARIAKGLELGQEYGFDDEGCPSCEANHKISDKQDKALRGEKK